MAEFSKWRVLLPVTSTLTRCSSESSLATKVEAVPGSALARAIRTHFSPCTRTPASIMWSLPSTKLASKPPPRLKMYSLVSVTSLWSLLYTEPWVSALASTGSSASRYSGCGYTSNHAEISVINRGKIPLTFSDSPIRSKNMGTITSSGSPESFISVAACCKMLNLIFAMLSLMNKESERQNISFFLNSKMYLLESCKNSVHGTLRHSAKLRHSSRHSFPPVSMASETQLRISSFLLIRWLTTLFDNRKLISTSCELRYCPESFPQIFCSSLF